MHDRREFLAGVAVTLLAGCGHRQPQLDKLRAIEHAAQGRLGAYILDTESQHGFGWRQDDRFAHCSSFKMSLAAMVLHLADQGSADLAEVLHWRAADMLPISPISEAHLEHGLSVEELAHATLVTSDNTAANVLLRRFGGPRALTAFWRSLGDNISQLDRYEPELNDVPAGQTWDSTTPKAMALTTAKLVQGAALTAPSRSKLRMWMTEVQTGAKRIRAGLPHDWISGDKTGTGIAKAKHTYVDLAFGGPRGRAPLIIIAYFEPARLVEPMDPVALDVLAEVGRIAASSIGAA